MADPLTAATIVTLILTKVFEKQGEKVGEIVWQKAGDVMSLLKRKAPSTASAIEKVAQQPELAQQQPTDFGQAKLVGEVEALAVSDPEVKAAIEALAALAKQENPQTWTIENWKGINIKGGDNTISGNTLTFS